MLRQTPRYETVPVRQAVLRRSARSHATAARSWGCTGGRGQRRRGGAGEGDSGGPTTQVERGTERALETGKGLGVGGLWDLSRGL